MPTVENVANRAGVADSLFRERLIDTARDGWMNRLIDLSRRNNLFFDKPVAGGAFLFALHPKSGNCCVSQSSGKRGSSASMVEVMVLEYAPKHNLQRVDPEHPSTRTIVRGKEGPGLWT
jgi:hypothetical protein